MELLFLLLPVAAFSGWLIGRAGKRKLREKDCPPYLNSRYFQGLNYLLDEQPDAALDVFIGMSEQNSESVEIQFALATLFLRRGEVERAIRIHQNLIARPTLSPQHKRQALFALGMDYMSAGLLDRAENLFRDLLNDSMHGVASRKQLLDIFQQEKEWNKAIEIAQPIRGDNRAQLAPIVAQYYCELAEQAMGRGDWVELGKHLHRALDWDKNCVRASLLEAELALQQGQVQRAIRACKRVESQDPDYLPLILAPLQQAYAELKESEEYLHYLEQLNQRFPRQQLVGALVALYIQRNERQRAEVLVNQELTRQPSLPILMNLLEVLPDHHAEPVHWQRLQAVTNSLLASKPLYQCRHCGYQGRHMLWLCPGCKSWNTIKPV